MRGVFFVSSVAFLAPAVAHCGQVWGNHPMASPSRAPCSYAAWPGPRFTATPWLAALKIVSQRLDETIGVPDSRFRAVRQCPLAWRLWHVDGDLRFSHNVVKRLPLLLTALR